MKSAAAKAFFVTLALVPAGLSALELELATVMSEELRDSVQNVVVLSSPDLSRKDVTGSYGEDAPGLIGGWNDGVEAGTVDVEVGNVPISVPIPILQVPAAIFGSLSGAVKEQLQEFRDALTEKLADAESSPLTHDALAMDVFWNMQHVGGLDSTVLAPGVKVPEHTDAVLFVNLDNLTIDVDGKDAIVTIAASGILRRKSDGSKLYESRASYQDRDSLKNWTQNDSALWTHFANFGRHYLGREIAAEIFDRSDQHHSLKPGKTKSVVLDRKDSWATTTKSSMPELAWEHRLPEGSGVDSVYFDLEIYDLQRPVYSAERIQATSHAIGIELECKTYRWSVRPVYAVGGKTRRGNWMRKNAGRDTGQGSVGVSASVAPAYLYDFATLKVRC